MKTFHIVENLRSGGSYHPKDFKMLTSRSIWLGALKHTAGYMTGWRLYFDATKCSLENDEIKELISTFVQSSYSAMNVKFYRNRHDGTFVQFDVSRD